MKRGTKQAQKEKSASTKHQTKSTQIKPTAKLSSRSQALLQSAASNKSGNIMGQNSYKRQLKDSKLLSGSDGRSSIQQKQKDTLKTSQNKDFNANNKISHTSITKNDKSLKQMNKKISDISEFLEQETKINPGLSIDIQNFSSSTSYVPQTINICHFDSKLHSPISKSQHLMRDLDHTPKDYQIAMILTEQQMLLRSGVSAASNNSHKQSGTHSHRSSKHFSQHKLHEEDGNNHENVATGEFQMAVDEELNFTSLSSNQKIVLNESLIKETAIIMLNSNNKHNTAIKENITQNKSAYKSQGQKENKSPSVGDIQAPYQQNTYTLKISDITEALNEYTQNNQSDDVNESENFFGSRLSPVQEKQSEEFQTLILNQTNALSTGINSHEFSMIQESPQASVRSSMTPQLQTLNRKESVQIVDKIEQLMKNILVEGQVYWEVKWKESYLIEQKLESSCTFETEEELKAQFGKEFLNMKDNYKQYKLLNL